MELLIIAGIFLTVGFVGWIIDETSDDDDDKETEGLELTGTEGADLLQGEAGADHIDALQANDTLKGAGGADTLLGGDGDDSIEGGTGSDFVLGGEGDDIVSAGTGNDFVNGQEGDDTLNGGDGADELRGGTGVDVLNGGANSDILLGGNGADSLYGNQSDDFLQGNKGADLLKGGKGADILDGYYDGNSDELFESQDILDPDVLKGGEDGDLLIMGSGDQAQGDSGADGFLTGTWVDENEDPVVTDFDKADDLIMVVVPVGASGSVSVVEDPDSAGAAQVQFDGKAVASVLGAFGDLQASDVVVIEADNFA